MSGYGKVVKFCLDAHNFYKVAKIWYKNAFSDSSRQDLSIDI